MHFALPELVGVVGGFCPSSTQAAFHLPFQRLMDWTLAWSQFLDGFFLFRLFFLVEVLEVLDLTLESLNLGVCLVFESFERLDLLIKRLDDLSELSQLMRALC